MSAYISKQIDQIWCAVYVINKQTNLSINQTIFNKKKGKNKIQRYEVIGEELIKGKEG